MLLGDLAEQGSNTRIQLPIRGGVWQRTYHGFGAKLALLVEQNEKEEGHMQRAEVWRWASEIISMFPFIGFRGVNNTPSQG